MLKFFGMFFLSAIASAVLLTADYFLPGTFLMSFIGGDFVQTFAAIFSFNIAAVIFLLGQLFVISKDNQDSFSRTRKEIKHNATYLLGSFILTLVLLTIRPDYITGLAFKSNSFYYLVNLIVLSLFLVALYAVYEILSAAFTLSKKY